MVKRGELTDEAWGRITPLLPAGGLRGGRWKGNRRVLSGILWKLRTGAPWRDLPQRYGPWQPCYDRFVRWRRGGTWGRLLAHAHTKSDAVGEIGWEVGVDSTVAQAHQHAAGARRRLGGRTKKGGSTPRRRGAGARSGRLLREGPPRLRRQGPPSILVTAVQRNEAPKLGALLDAIRVARPAGSPGRPCKRPDRLLADRGYAHDSCRVPLRRRNIPHVIPERRDQEERRSRRGGRPPPFDAEAYRGRNEVGRCVNRLEQWRGVATRY